MTLFLLICSYEQEMYCITTLFFIYKNHILQNEARLFFFFFQNQGSIALKLFLNGQNLLKKQWKEIIYYTIPLQYSLFYKKAVLSKTEFFYFCFFSYFFFTFFSFFFFLKFEAYCTKLFLILRKNEVRCSYEIVDIK